MTMLILLYLLIQTGQLIAYEETDIMVSSFNDFFSDKDLVSGDLKFAFAFSSYDEIYEVEEDPTIVTVDAAYRIWGETDFDFNEYLRPIETRPCTIEELGLEKNPLYDEDDPDSEEVELIISEDRSKTDFYPPKKISEEDLQSYWKKFKCMDIDVEIAGDYNT